MSTSLVHMKWVALLLQLSLTASQPADEYCPGYSFHAHCSDNEVIVMETSWYGRMRIGSCVKEDKGFIGCKTDVTDIADKICSGRRDCEIRVRHLQMDERLSHEPRCEGAGELSRYLQTSYTCRKIIHNGKQACKHQAYVDVINSISNNIASLVSNETGCGLPDAPWVLEAQPGQRINLSLTDFSPAMARTRFKDCHPKLGVVRDLQSGALWDVCGGWSRQRHLLTSEGYKLQITLNKEAVSVHSFLISYQVIGCPDLIKPKDAWLRRNNNSIVVGCHGNKQTWHLHCHGNRWQGVIGNCTHQLVIAQEVFQADYVRRAISNEYLVFIIIGIALIICLSIIAAGAGFLVYKRHRMGDYTKPEEYPEQRNWSDHHKKDAKNTTHSAYLPRNHYGHVSDYHSDVESETTEYQLPNHTQRPDETSMSRDDISAFRQSMTSSSTGNSGHGNYQISGLDRNAFHT